MAYKVFITTGRGKNKSTAGSIELPNKERVSRYIKRSPLVRSNTKIEVENIRSGKKTTGTQGKFFKNPITKKFRY